MTLLSLQVFNVRFALDEPEQLVDHRAGVDLAIGEQGKAVGKVKAHLVAEQAARAGARAIGPRLAVNQNLADEIEVRLHGADHNRDKVQSKSTGMQDRLCTKRVNKNPVGVGETYGVRREETLHSVLRVLRPECLSFRRPERVIFTPPRAPSRRWW